MAARVTSGDVQMLYRLSSHLLGWRSERLTTLVDGMYEKQELAGPSKSRTS